MSEGNLPNNAGFNGRVMLCVVGAAILSFVGYLLLSAYAPDMKSGESERAHALSQSAVGYSALVKLQDELDRNPTVIRTKKGLKTDRLLVVTPDLSTSSEALAALIRDRSDRPTLIILPKRLVRQNPKRRGWVVGRTIAHRDRVSDLIKSVAAIKVAQRRAAVTDRFTSVWAPPITFVKGTVVQTISGTGLEPYITNANGDILLAGVVRENAEDDDYTPTYILSDPDVMNNLGLARSDTAWAATEILRDLADIKSNEVGFDVTLNGYETVSSGNSLLKLIFEPPFLALSLCLFVASLMALWHGLMRFGAPLRDMPAFAPGKRALVDNSADLLRLAEREYAVGDRYAAMTRDLAAQGLGLPQMMSADLVTQRLDAISRDGPLFSQLMRAAAEARNSQDMLAAARALFRWRKDRI